MLASHFTLDILFEQQHNYQPQLSTPMHIPNFLIRFFILYTFTDIVTRHSFSSIHGMFFFVISNRQPF